MSLVAACLKKLITTAKPTMPNVFQPCLLIIQPSRFQRLNDCCPPGACSLLELQAAVIATQDPVRARFRLQAAEGTIEITHLETGKSFLLPMDPGIHIQNAHLKAGQLILEGKATISP